jgi:hypothetical protein
VIYLVVIGSIAGFGQLVFNAWQTVLMHREHKARLADEKRMTADEKRLDIDEARMGPVRADADDSGGA